MNVNIEVQYLCTEHLRGIPYYMINLIENLVKRNRNEYAVSFYDYNKERNNRAYIEKYLAGALSRNLKLKECNTISYKTILEACENGNAASYNKYSYDEYFGERFDVYHFPSAQGVQQNLVGKNVVTVHDVLPIIPEFSNGWNKNVEGQFKSSLEFIRDRKDILVVADSVCTKKDLIERASIDEERIFVVPLAYDKEIHFIEQNKQVLESLNIHSSYILYLGVLDFRKGVVNILEAFEKIKPMYPELKLVLAGTLHPIVTSIVEKLKNYKYIDDVILTGFVSDEQKRILLSSAEVFLFPSEYEGFGLPVLEAMACGAPVITTNVSSLPEVGGDAALYVSPENPEELAEAIRNILDSEMMRNEYIKKGFAQCKKFSWDKTAEMMEEIYQIAHNM